MSFRLSHLAPLCLVALAWGFAGPVPARADPASCPIGEVGAAGGCKAEAAAASEIGATVEAMIAKNDLQSAIVRVSVDGRPLLTRAWGQSMTGVAATPDMHFRNGAIAITYMGTLLLQLQDRGLLHADDKLSKWFPDYPKADEITLAMLARSTSGYADYVNLDVLPLYANVFRAWQAQELIDIGLKQEMRCAPGTCFAYAHTNFVILGEVFAKATGRDLTSLLRDYILDPLGLRQTASNQSAAMPEPVQHAYTAERGIYEDSTFWNPSWTLARGGVMTTDIRDALTSIEAIGSGRLLSAETYKQLTAPVTAHFAPFSATTYYGMGVVISNGWLVQTPSFGGYAVAVGYEPERRIAIAASVTAGPKTADENLAQAIFTELAAYLRPDRAPEGRRQRPAD